MLKGDLSKDELEKIVKALSELQVGKDLLAELVLNIFKTFDKDANGYLDRRELRHFLTSMFETYHISLPLTDEYVDAVFREVDENKDNKIQPEEL